MSQQTPLAACPASEVLPPIPRPAPELYESPLLPKPTKLSGVFTNSYGPNSLWSPGLLAPDPPSSLLSTLPFLLPSHMSGWRNVFWFVNKRLISQILKLFDCISNLLSFLYGLRFSKLQSKIFLLCHVPEMVSTK